MSETWWQRAVDLLTKPSGYLGLGTMAMVGVASTALLLTRSPARVDYGIDYDHQGVLMEDGSYASVWTAQHGKPIECLYEDAKTVYECFLRGKRISGDQKCLGARTGPNREYEWITYNQVYDRMQAFGSGLFSLGIKPGQDTNIGVFAQNRPEWVITDQACQMYSMVTVALYDTLGAEAVVFTINLCEMSAIVCDTAARAQLLMDKKRHMTSLNIIVMIEEVTQSLRQAAQSSGIKILHFTEVENLGKKNLREPLPPKPSDLLTICFTSGTTGNPKGAMLTHGNLVADIAAAEHRKFPSTRPEDAHISYLPLAHMFERVNIANVFSHGSHAGFFSRDINLLFDDLQTLRPTGFPTVPRLLNKIRDKVMIGVEHSKIKSFLLRLALSRKLKEVKRGVIRRDSVWDKLVFRKIHALLGGNVTVVATGSAALSAEVFDFARCALGCQVIEGYGQTEATAAATLTWPGDPTPGHVGPPLDCNYIKLIDVPEMQYFAKDGIGEVCVKGTNVMKGYYHDPEKTKEAFTADGWLRTGDVGIFNKNGTLRIVDRCKHIFKLSQGEYIAPERVESIYTRSKYVQQCFVDGDSLKSRCVAIVVPEPDIVLLWASNNNRQKDIHTLCQDETLRQVILEDMWEIGKDAELKGFEQVMDIQLEAEPFSLQAGLITPTFKNKRPQLRRHFAHQVAQIYGRHNKGQA
ncbi:long-chain-fatty-acid--CoA ligase 5-like [Babylonia areolata]|uniref:long-chain-fatty-acid--CoA ligase 5-like n=1 Tax=Babylonia areolata TaxID=304850 RepID=UPI003FD22CFA